ncbi:hypothetical protein HMPREF1863_00956 [Aedoeadaptatus coxii]|uniref:Uncharacterized protein n=1 Tax=Aedoeadaptatus coxii TaxID=755172 RepID=A0A134AGD7_9FIRM|nr:hypothetical protein HMPREF1863_00956 [Peptoniphilus coxii]
MEISRQSTEKNKEMSNIEDKKSFACLKPRKKLYRKYKHIIKSLGNIWKFNNITCLSHL